jgi:hypothetical protein
MKTNSRKPAAKSKRKPSERSGGRAVVVRRVVRRQDVMTAINSASGLLPKGELNGGQIALLMRCCMEGAASVEHMLRLAEGTMKAQIRINVEKLYAS